MQTRHHYLTLALLLLVLGGCAQPQVSGDLPRATDAYRSGKSLVKSGLDPVTAPDNLFPFSPITQLEEFRHSSGLFTVRVPQGWTISDRLEGGKLAVSWVDPNQNGVIAIEIFPSPANANTKELIQVDRRFIGDQFDLFPDFFIDEAKPQPDGSFKIVWGYNYFREQQETRAVFNRFFQQKGPLTAIITVGFLEQNFDKVQNPYLQILDSFQVDTNVTFPQTPNAPAN